MELKMNNGFCEMTEQEMLAIDGGDAVEAFVEFVGGMYDGWCDMWYQVGKNVASWVKGEV